MVRSSGIAVFSKTLNTIICNIFVQPSAVHAHFGVNLRAQESVYIGLVAASGQETDTRIDKLCMPDNESRTVSPCSP